MASRFLLFSRLHHGGSTFEGLALLMDLSERKQLWFLCGIYRTNPCKSKLLISSIHTSLEASSKNIRAYIDSLQSRYTCPVVVVSFLGFRQPIQEFVNVLFIPFKVKIVLIKLTSILSNLFYSFWILLDPAHLFVDIKSSARIMECSVQMALAAT